MGKTLVRLVPIELDRPRKLKFDFNALAMAEEVLGKPPLEALRPLAEAKGADLKSPDFGLRAMGLISFRSLRALIWAGLLHEDPELTIEDVGRALSLDNFGEALGAALEALVESQPEPGEVPTGPSQAQ